MSKRHFCSLMSHGTKEFFQCLLTELLEALLMLDTGLLPPLGRLLARAVSVNFRLSLRVVLNEALDNAPERWVRVPNEMSKTVVPGFTDVVRPGAVSYCCIMDIPHLQLKSRRCAPKSHPPVAHDSPIGTRDIVTVEVVDNGDHLLWCRLSDICHAVADHRHW